MFTNTHSEYVILTEFTLQKWSQEPCTCTLPCLFVVSQTRRKLDDAIGGENALPETVKIF